MADRPIGQRFSQVYLKRGQPTADSERLRRRIAAHYRHNIQFTKNDLNDLVVQEIRQETGAEITYRYSTYNVDDTIEKAELRDFLDVITIVWIAIKTSHTNLADSWLEFVGRAFREENMPYTLDERGGVHYFRDEEFARNRAATLHGLGESRYEAARGHFEAAYVALDEVPPNTSTGLREVFLAVETVAKLLDAGAKLKGLGVTEVERHLKPVCTGRYPERSIERNAANGLVNGLKEWTTALQPYRHAQPHEEPQPAPLDLTVALMSTGASYLRFLVETDQELQRGS